jgi:hypothetical protein
MAVVAATVILTTQGCCSVFCADYNKRQVTHTFALGVNMAEYSCPIVTCVCPVPKGVTVRPGDKVRFVNTSDYRVTIRPADGRVFTVSDDIVVEAKESVTRTVSDPIPDELGEGIGTDMFVGDPPDPNLNCPGLPGPGIDWD